jgi:putative copper export protein
MNPITAAALAEWPPLFCMLVICGSTAAALAFRRYSPPADTLWLGGIERVWAIMAVAALVTAPIAILSDASRMAGIAPRDVIPLLPEILRLTHAGRLWIWRFGFILADAGAALWLPEGSLAKATCLAVFSALGLFGFCAAGHAIDPGSMAVIAGAIHELSAATWIGALTLLLCVAGDAGDLLAGKTATLVSRFAGWSVSGLLLSGAYLAWLALGIDAGDLIYSAYGRTLLAKVALFALVVSMGGYNRYRLVPAAADGSARRILLRNAGIECLLLAGVIGLGTLLANTPPPH